MRTIAGAAPHAVWRACHGFLGNARGSAGIFEFDDKGHYRQYTYGEMRSYNIVSRFSEPESSFSGTLTSYPA